MTMSVWQPEKQQHVNSHAEEDSVFVVAVG